MLQEVIDLTALVPPAEMETPISLGTACSPNGSRITATRRSLERDGRPWLPVMGEFHYTRYPEDEWRDALLKMQAGGIDIVASYVFWIHHEEVENVFDWTGRRDLRRFVRLCGELGLPFAARLGPWCHGEVRNGGHPDWLLQKPLVPRSDDPLYLEYAARFFGEVAGQLRGQLWKEGGPVAAVQCENEYGGPAEHLLSLKRLVCDAGLDVPLYTRTGWPDLATPMPLGEFLPLYGGYADGFWDRSLEEMPAGYRNGFLFTAVRADAAIATDQLGERAVKENADDAQYPYLGCEIGGGMERSYHRRICIDSEDIAASALIKIGSGNNLQGYYMYHGGTNPDGRLSTLQESQAGGMWNDLPVKSYDFQAPLGEFGQIRPHYHRLRRLHLFLRDFGASLAPMPAQFPKTLPTSAADLTTLRWSVRTDGQSGFLFVSNYQRLQPLPAKEDVRFELCLPEACLMLPREPVTVPADTVFFWPFGLDLAGATLRSATAQPVCRIAVGGTQYFVFAETPGIAAEFIFESAGVSVESARGEVTAFGDQVCVRSVRSGADVAIQIQIPTGQSIAIILLDDEQSLTCWKGTLAGQERLFLTSAGLILDGDRLRLSSVSASALTVGIFPPPQALRADGCPVPGIPDGLFRRYAAPCLPAPAVEVTWEQVQAAGPARQISKGSQGAAEAPTDADFENAAVWRLRLPPDIDPSRGLRLSLGYRGDAARLYWNGELLTDNFYNGTAFELGLKRYAPAIYSGELLLKVLPLCRDAPIYLPPDAWPEFGPAGSVAELGCVEIIEEQKAEFACL